MHSAAAVGAAPLRLHDVTDAGGFRQLLDTFHRAAARYAGERIRQTLSFAGRPAVLDVVGRARFDRLAPTFAHLRAASPTSPPITLSIWDETLTGLAAPPLSDDAQLVWRRDDWLLSSHAAPSVGSASVAGKHRGAAAPGFGSAPVAGNHRGAGQHRCLREARPGRVACLDRLADHLVIAYDSSSSVSLQEQGRPAARMLAQIYRGLGVHRVHAGLVAHGDAGALLVGASGGGKTTLALEWVAWTISPMTSRGRGGLRRGVRWTQYLRLRQRPAVSPGPASRHEVSRPLGLEPGQGAAAGR
jgi:hypothetical protein